jgi:hypothetical protein
VDIPDMIPKLMPVSEKHFKFAMKGLKIFRDSLWLNLQTFSKQIEADKQEFEFAKEDLEAIDIQLQMLKDELEVVDDIIYNFNSSVAVALSDEDTTVQ